MKKTVIFAEMLYPKGHKVLNENYIRLLSEISNLIVIDNGKYFSCMNIPQGVHIINIHPWEPNVLQYLKIQRKIPFLKFYPIIWFSCLYNIILIYFKIRNLEYDKIIFSSIRYDMLSIALKVFKLNSIVVFHHSDIDDVIAKPKKKRQVEKSFNKYEHIVLADFIRDGIIENFNVKKERIHVVYQPLIDKIDDTWIDRNVNNNTIIGLGQTLGEDTLQQLIGYDKKYTSKLPYTITLRHKAKEYIGNNLKVINGYLNREQFVSYLKESIACVIFYPDSFNLRYSGIVDDALSHGLIVYGNNLPIIKYFSQKYPDSCFSLNSYDDIFKLGIHIDRRMSKMDFNLFVKIHSDENVKFQLQKILDPPSAIKTR